jgi:histidinol-phosphate aminotransferase
MYRVSAEGVGGTVQAIAPRPEFVFPLEELIAAIDAQVKLVFLTNPDNPTGRSITPDVVRQIASAAPDATVFLDEAYVDFGGRTFIPLLEAAPNVIVGRTFAKAHGLAALRVGALVTAGPIADSLRRVLPPYNMNVYALAGLRAALEDPGYLQWYCSQVAESKRLVYAACERLGLKYWPSDGNFVLLRVGPRAAAVVRDLEGRGISLRDRSREPGCDGCIRITAGVVEHTRQGLAALEEVLCGAR